MNTKIKSVLAAASVLALSALTANAQLFTVTAVNSTFSNPSTGVTFLGNGTSVASANIANPGTSTLGLTTNGITGNINNFGFPPFTVDTWSIDQKTQPGAIAEFDYKIDVTLASFANPLLTTVLTETFHISFSQFGGDINGTTYAFTLTGSPITPNFTLGANTYSGLFSAFGVNGTIGANQTNPPAGIQLAIYQVVPEPSTYALFGVVGLMSVVAVRRIRSSKKVA